MPNLSVTQWYALALLVPIGTWIFIRLLYFAGANAYRWCVDQYLSHVAYPAVLPSRCDTTRQEGIGVVFLVVANSLCLGISCSNSQELSSRAGVLATIHLIPLLLGTRLSAASDLLGLSLRTMTIFHRWLGAMCASEAVIHTTISLRSLPKRWDQSSIFGATSSGCFVTLVVLSLPFFRRVRRHMYEVYLRSHFGVTAVGSLALWRHIALQRRPSRLYIVGGLIMWTVIVAWRVLATLYRNLHLTGHHWLPRVDVRSTDSDSNRLENVCHAEVVGCRPWTVKPGQYVYLWVPGVSLTSPFQSHPFWVIWWDVDDKHHLVLYLLIRERHGFTSRLLSQCDQRFRAAISGPFGRSVEVGKFGTVLMFATDIGIASHIPYIKSLLEGRYNSEICTRRILVVWQIQRSDHHLWIKKWINEFVPGDKYFMLTIKIHHPGIEEQTLGRAGSFNMVSGPADFVAELEDEIQRPGRGRLLVMGEFSQLKWQRDVDTKVASVDGKSRSLLRQSIGQWVDSDVRYFEPDFQPPQSSRRALVLD